MQHLPIFARVAGQPCLVVGGGEVARRKVMQLRSAGARVTVNAPELCAGLRELAAEGAITVHEAPFDDSLLDTHLLVIAATSDPGVNRAVAAAARARFRLCNVVDDPGPSTFISPSVIDRSPLIIAISSGGAAPVLARVLRQQLEHWLPAGIGDLAGWARRWREAVRQRFPDVVTRRRFWEQVFDGDLGRHVLAGRMAAADADIAAALAGDGPATSGEAWIVGAGPGDPELLTLRGFQLLQHADVVLHDRLVSPRLLEFARRDAAIIDVGKTGGGPSTDQADINRMLVQMVTAGKRVCRLKGGDPLIFGRGAEEVAALSAAGLAFRIVPGITSASGCAAATGIPLTHRGLADAVTLLTAERAQDADPDWPRLAQLGHTLVIYMVSRRLGDVAISLVRHGRPAQTPAAVVAAGTTPAQQAPARRPC
jgi:uroporphyrin-III C-methyltransferase/precorrin-2 dehydrogenase/sirohydrochlorin ferrochelatase